MSPPKTRGGLVISLTCGLLLTLPVPGTGEVNAQQYPVRPVRLVVPYPPGGGTDLLARLIVQPMTEMLGQPLVIDNRSGANGIIGTDLVAKAKPDGYTALLTIASHAINPSIYARLPYDSLRDLQPLTLLAEYPFVIVAHPSLPIRSVRELITMARSRPGTLVYASSGLGSGPHLGMELLRVMSGIDIRHVPYRGAGPATTDLLSGQVQLMMHNLLAGGPMIKSGRLRPIAVTGAVRIQAMPEIPTVSEAALKGFTVTGWYGALMPSGVPEHSSRVLMLALSKAIRTNEVVERLAADAATVIASTPVDFERFIKAEMERWASVAGKAGIQRQAL